MRKVNTPTCIKKDYSLRNGLIVRLSFEVMILNEEDH